MASETGILDGEVCSGNGMFSQSAAVCICNAGWQVRPRPTPKPPTIAHTSHFPLLLALPFCNLQNWYTSEVSLRAGAILPGAGRLQWQPRQPRQLLPGRTKLRPDLL